MCLQKLYQHQKLPRIKPWFLKPNQITFIFCLIKYNFFIIFQRLKNLWLLHTDSTKQLENIDMLR